MTMPVIVFAIFVIFVLGLSFYLGNRAKSAGGYFAAGGQIHWTVNGIAFAGDYLSAASFLGICGMIAVYGYDGFLYSIGYLAGWIVALFIVAEPMKRLGKYTFTDALDSKFNSKGIQFAAAISTLVVSICYLIPQMVGAGVLVTPLLNLPHEFGVAMVGTIVIIIVATAGMASTTYVQFIKGALLIVFSTVLVMAVCSRGLSTEPESMSQIPGKTITASQDGEKLNIAEEGYSFVSFATDGAGKRIKPLFAKLMEGEKATWWKVEGAGENGGSVTLRETQWITKAGSGEVIFNGDPEVKKYSLPPVGNLVKIEGKSGEEAKTGSIGPFAFLAKLAHPETEVVTWRKSASFSDATGNVTVYYPHNLKGNEISRPGQKFKVDGSGWDRLNFVSLMLALFFGTAALPHILIRYYTVPSPAAARKSTIVAIAGIGFFYVLTEYMGLGAMVNGVLNAADSNMAAPMLARAFGDFLFAVISAIAFATVLGTVSGLIVAASGAVAHDLLDRFGGMNMKEKSKVRAGKIAALVVGVVAIILGIIFQGVNVSFLVGWAFAVAASANLPAILMLLFWKKTTAMGIVASILVGAVSALGIILISPAMYKQLYHLNPADAIIPISNPGIISIPLSFITLVVVSLMTQKPESKQEAAA